MKTRITTPDNHDSLTVADYVKKNFKTAQLFNKYQIDYCCGGKQLLKTTCKEKGLSYEEVLSAIEDLSQQNPESNLKFNEWELSFLADYIVNVHHKYVREAIIRINPIAQKVASSHGNQYPETIDIAAFFDTMSHELTSHMNKEENILFPYIRSLETYKRSKTDIHRPPFLTARNPITMLEDEHQKAGDLIHSIAKLTNSFTPPDNACNTLCVLYEELKEFENDLHIHVHLENNILFPKAIELESELFA